MLKKPRCFVHISTDKTKMILVVLADVIYLQSWGSLGSWDAVLDMMDNGSIQDYRTTALFCLRRLSVELNLSALSL